MRHQRRHSPFAQLWFGGFLILLGVLFLLENLGLADTHEIIARGWPLLLIAAGVSRLVNSGSAESRIAGAIWLSVGAIFLLSNLGYLPFNVWRLIWPITLIAFGTLMVMRSRVGCSVPVETASKIRPMAFMGGVDRRVNSKTFEGGEMTAIMGGCKIDLREADIQGPEAI